MDERAARSALAALTARLEARGHNGPLDGNVSLRLPDGDLLTTPTGRTKGDLTPDDLVRLAPDGTPRGGGRPSSELRLHLAVYAARLDVHAIVHAHSPHVVALSIAGVSFEPPLVPESYLTLGPVLTVPYATPTTLDVAEAAAEVARQADVIVLERHGPVALGPDLATAAIRLETLEHVARITWLARALGPVEGLPEAAIEGLRALRGGWRARPLSSRAGCR